MNATSSRPLCLLITVLAIVLGCSRPESDTRKVLEQLAPLPEPQISGAKPEVQKQINDQRAVVEAALEGFAGSGGRDADGIDAPKLAEDFTQLGLIYVTYEFLDAAEVCLANAVRLQPDAHRFVYLHGYLLKIQGRIAEAAVLLERALELSPGDVPTVIRLGSSRLELGELEAAKAHFDRALELRPASAAALEGLGKLAASDADIELAAALFERALELQPTAKSLHYSLGQAYRRLGNLEKAEYHLERRGDARVLVDDPLLRPIADLARSAEFYMVQAGQALENRRYDAAAGSYRRALEYDPGNFGAYRGLSFALRQLGDPEGAIAELQRGLAVGSTGSEDRDRVGRAGIGAFLAQMLIAEGRVPEALGHLAKALEDDPERVEFRSLLADTLARVRRFEEALVEYDRVHAARPESAGTLVKRAMVKINLGRRREAKRDFELAIEADPESPDMRLRYAEALDFMGDAAGAAKQRKAAAEPSVSGSNEVRLIADKARRLRGAGKRQEAIEAYRQALALEPKLATERYDLALLLAEVGRNNEAALEFGRVIEEIPPHADAHRNLVAILLIQGQHLEARNKLRDALQVLPREVRFAHALARLLATAPDAEVRNAGLSLQLAERVRQVRDEAETRATLAMAYAESGRWQEALALQRALVATLAEGSSDRDRAEARLSSYENNRPWRIDSPDDILAALRGGAS